MIFFTMSDNYWYVIQKESNLKTVVTSQNDSKSFRPISTTPADFQFFLDFGKNTILKWHTFDQIPYSTNDLIAIWFLFEISEINFPLQMKNIEVRMSKSLSGMHQRRFWKQTCPFFLRHMILKRDLPFDSFRYMLSKHNFFRPPKIFTRI